MLNLYREIGPRWFLPVATSQAAGTPIQYAAGVLNGFLETDADANDSAWVNFGKNMIAANITAAAADDMGVSAIAVGDLIYNDSGTYNKDAANGVLFGIALGALATGTGTVPVLAL